MFGFLTINAFAINASIQKQQSASIRAHLTYVSTINIDGNSALAALASSGNGSIGNPYIISDYIISNCGLSGIGVSIQNVDSYFILDNINVTYCLDGFYFYNVEFGSIINSLAADNTAGGFILFSSFYNNLTNDIATHNTDVGFTLDSAASNYLNKDTATYNDVGFGLVTSNSNTLENNIGHYNKYNYVADTASSTGNTLTNNDFTDPSSSLLSLTKIIIIIAIIGVLVLLAIAFYITRQKSKKGRSQSSQQVLFKLNNDEKRIIEKIFEINNGRNKRNIEKLITKLTGSTGIVPFVGAGMSIPFGYKGWGQFLLAIGETWGITEEILPLINASMLEDAAQKLINKRTKNAFDEEIVDTFKLKKFDNATLKASAVSFLPYFTKKIVITTNFDQVLEKIFTNAHKDFKQIINGPYRDEIVKTLESNELSQIKIHGSIGGESVNRIVSKEDYDRYYTHSNEFPMIFKQLMSRYCLVFFGCSLNRDRTLELLQEVAAELDIEHFAFLQLPNGSQEMTLKENDLIRLYKITPLWYLDNTTDPSHSSLNTLLKYITIQILSKK